MDDWLSQLVEELERNVSSDWPQELQDRARKILIPFRREQWGPARRLSNELLCSTSLSEIKSWAQRLSSYADSLELVEKAQATLEQRAGLADLEGALRIVDDALKKFPDNRKAQLYRFEIEAKYRLKKREALRLKLKKNLEGIQRVVASEHEDQLSLALWAVWRMAVALERLSEEEEVEPFMERIRQFAKLRGISPEPPEDRGKELLERVDRHIEEMQRQGLTVPPELLADRDELGRFEPESALKYERLLKLIEERLEEARMAPPKPPGPLPGEPLSRREPTAQERAVVELLASYGAAAQPDNAEILQVMSSIPTPSELLRELPRKGRGLLSDDLLADVDQEIAKMGGGESPAAPSSLARLHQVLDRARDQLGRVLAGQRVSLATQLRQSGLLIEKDHLRQALEGLWRSESSQGLAGQLASVDHLSLIRQTLSQADSSNAAGAAGVPSERQFEEREETGKAHARLRALWNQLRHPTDSSGDSSRTAADRLRRQAAGLVEQLLEVTAQCNKGVEVFRPALGSWETVLGTLLGADTSMTDAVARVRQATARDFRTEVERLRRLSQPNGAADQASADHGDMVLAEKLEWAALEGGACYEEIFREARGRLVRLRSEAEARLVHSAANLRAASGELASLLSQEAVYLPTERVIQARVRIEQLESLISAREFAAMPSLLAAIHEDLERLGKVAAEKKSDQADREKAGRSRLREEAGALKQVASRRLARQLEALRKQAESAGPGLLPQLRARFDGTRREIGQTIRLEGARVLHQGKRWIQKKRQKASGTRLEREQEFGPKLKELADAMLEDDLVALGRSVARARAALREVDPWRPPWLHAALIVVGVAVVAGALVVWRQVGEPTQTFLLKLASKPESTVEIWLVQDGRIVEKRSHQREDSGVRFRRPPGRYEVWVDGSYTGRVVRVPDEREVDGIPVLRRPRH